MFWKALLHAALGGFAAGFSAAGFGAGWKVSLASGAASALTSVLSLFSTPPKTQ